MITRTAYCTEVTSRLKGERTARLTIEGEEVELSLRQGELNFEPGQSYTLTIKAFSFDDLDPPRQAPPRP
jgi:hypothetical protein